MIPYKASLLLPQRARATLQVLRCFSVLFLFLVAGSLSAQQMSATESSSLAPATTLSASNDLGPLVALVDAPEPQTPQASTQSNGKPGSITGTVFDIDSLVIPNATITVEGPTPADRRTATTGQDGTFIMKGIEPGITYKVTISAKNFADFNPPEVLLGPGQKYEISGIKLAVAPVSVNIIALTPQALAIEQESEETHQRIFGVIPNFYVVYDHAFAPLSTQLKYKLAFKSSFDVVNAAAALFLGAINQASDRPDYRQGLIGYGERVGAVYVDGVTDIIFGGAVLPSLLHQDPRYFYEGTGSNKKKRFLHAISAPIICKGDNGKDQFNYSSIGGDLISGAFSNIYYPPHDRGVGLVFSNVAIAAGGRMVNALAQEFVFLKFTSRAKPTP